MTEEVRSLSMEYSGLLHVFITTMSGEVFDDWKHLHLVKGATLFDYVGQALACIFCNMTTCLQIESCPSCWEVEEFSPEKGILRVRQIDGEPLEFQEDDPRKLYLCYGIITEIGWVDIAEN